MEDKIVSLVKKFIEVPSTKDNPQALEKILGVAQKNIQAPFIQKFVHNGIPSIFAANRQSFGEKFRLVLNAHIDVVPGRSEQFQPLIKDGKLFGRGAADMKSAAAVMLLVFNSLVEKVSFPLGLQVTTDEEVGGHNGTLFQLQKGLTTDFVISGELTNFAINLKAKGIIQVKITAKGKTAHSAYPWKGESAMWKLINMLRNLAEEFPVPTEEAWQTTINAAKITTPNMTINKLPDDATVELDIRFTPEELAKVRGTLDDIRKQGFEVIVLQDEPAQFADKDNPSVQLLEKSIEKITQQKTAFIVKHGASDVRHFNVFSCPGVVFGPQGEGLHSDNEWVDIQSLSEYYAILENFILSVEEQK